MLELGERARILHRQALEDALRRSVDLIVATGLFAEAAQWVAPAPGAPELVAVSGMKEAEELLLQRLGGTEVVLLKASRGVEMETLLPALEGRFGPPAPASSGNSGSLPSVPPGPTALGVSGRREA
jgi:UDP-N-acetylmuramyl pentapeptide synthase